LLTTVRIHHNEALIELVESASLMLDHLSRYLTDTPGCLILYLPPYSPDLAPIEKSFSACMYWLFKVIYMCAIHLLLMLSFFDFRSGCRLMTLSETRIEWDARQFPLLDSSLW
jgi:transposase